MVVVVVVVSLLVLWSDLDGGPGRRCSVVGLAIEHRLDSWNNNHHHNNSSSVKDKCNTNNDDNDNDNKQEQTLTREATVARPRVPLLHLLRPLHVALGERGAPRHLTRVHVTVAPLPVAHSPSTPNAYPGVSRPSSFELWESGWKCKFVSLKLTCDFWTRGLGTFTYWIKIWETEIPESDPWHRKPELTCSNQRMPQTPRRPTNLGPDLLQSDKVIYCGVWATPGRSATASGHVPLCKGPCGRGTARAPGAREVRTRGRNKNIIEVI